MALASEFLLNYSLGQSEATETIPIHSWNHQILDKCTGDFNFIVGNQKFWSFHQKYITYLYSHPNPCFSDDQPAFFPFLNNESSDTFLPNSYISVAHSKRTTLPLTPRFHHIFKHFSNICNCVLKMKSRVMSTVVKSEMGCSHDKAHSNTRILIYFTDFTWFPKDLLSFALYNKFAVA